MKTRKLVPEWMDDPRLNAVAHRQALNGLRRINRISRTAWAIATKIKEYAKTRKLVSGRILDLGCGSGDVAYGVAKLLSSKGDWQIEGWDISPTAVDYARQLYGNDLALAPLAHPKLSAMVQDGLDSDEAGVPRRLQSNVTFHQQDVFQADDTKFDFVYCSLFLHHFSDLDAIRLLKRMRGLARHLVIVDDLHRSRIGYWMARIGVQVLSRSPIVHFDGPQSVRAAFAADEIIAIARMAGLTHVTLERRFPSRWLLTEEVG
jgi:SAM-dependent methyltransferase